MEGFTEELKGKNLPLVTVFELKKGWLFRIITEETILDLEEKDAKRLYRQLHTAFRPTQRALDGAKAPRKSKRSAGSPRK